MNFFLHSDGVLMRCRVINEAGRLSGLVSMQMLLVSVLWRRSRLRLRGAWSASLQARVAYVTAGVGLCFGCFVALSVFGSCLVVCPICLIVVCSLSGSARLWRQPGIKYCCLKPVIAGVLGWHCDALCIAVVP